MTHRDDRRPPQFDAYAASYRDLHRDSVQASGEEPDYFAAYKIRYMARVLAQAPATVLDFGCGVGNSLGHLREAFPAARLHGVDVSGASLEIAAAEHPDVAFQQLGTRGLPLEDHSVDVAFAACVYHHVPPAERARWTQELHRVLKPGGELFIFEHNPLNPLTQKVVRECPFDDDAILLPRSESVGLMRDAGFARVGVDYIVFFPKALGFLRALEPALAKVPFGAQYVARGRKASQ